MILMNDFKAEPEALLQAELGAVERVLRSGWYILGKEVTQFEAAWANRCGVPYALGVGNGMDAIEIGLRALGITAGDEVITTPMTAFATVLAILRAGATPVLADIEPDTGLLSLESVARCVTTKTKAVLLVHLYGQVRNMKSWQDLCQTHGLHLLEDCAQSHLACEGGTVAGSFGEFGAYSFYPTKNLGAIGDGGALITKHVHLAEVAGRLRNYGQSQRYHHSEIGMNSRLDELQAAILTERLAYLDEFTERRQQIAEQYFSSIHHSQIKLLAKPLQRENHVYHLFVLCCEQRDALSQHLSAAGIANLSHYPVPVHRQPPCAAIKMDTLGLSSAEHHAQTCLSIPCHPQMSDADVQKVIEAVNGF